MENTTRVNTFKPDTFNTVKTKVIHGVILVTITFFISRTPLIGEAFPAAIAFVAYMVSRNTIYIYLALPSAAGIFFCINKGCDSWGELAALLICAVIFAAARKIKLSMWQRGLISSAAAITCVSIYRLAMGTVYKTSIQALLLEGLLIFLFIFLFDAFEKVLSSRQGGNLSLASLAVICLLLVCGTGIEFLIWPFIIFLTLFVLVYGDIGKTSIVITTSAVFAFLVDQTQWGLMVTLLIGTYFASFCKKFGAAITAAVFTAVCIGLKSAESGIVLGTDNYCLFLSLAAFAAVNWKFGSHIKKGLNVVFGNNENLAEDMNFEAENILSMQAGEMKELAELYSTYVDSRSMLGTQFDITKQIIEETRWMIGEQGKISLKFTSDKFDTDIAISQCAAAGEINGDCCGWQDIGDGRTAMIISDGMGKGKKAATESLMVTKTIMGLLKAGASTDLTLKMINTIMVMKDDEDSFATVDLIILDKKIGKAKFYKIGAAPTLIRRKNSVEEVKLSAVPLGIVNGIKIQYVEAFLKKGDYIIMMSDGVSDGGGGRGFLNQLKEIVLNIRSENPQTICDLILNQSADSYIGKERDDLTVLVAKLM